MKKTATLFAIFYALFSFGQTETSNEKMNSLSAFEKIQIQLNTTTFVTGEKLLYRINCSNLANSKPSQVSKVAHVILCDVSKKVQFNHKVFLENGHGEGDFFINTTIPSGNYLIIGYTHWMLNQPASHLFQAPIKIINPFQVIDNKDFIDKETQTVGSFSTQNEDVLKLDFEKMSFDIREKINVKIKTTNLEKGNFCIAVRKIDSLSTGFYATKNKAKNNISNPNSPLKTQLILPEIRGENITGKIINLKTPLDLNNKSVSMSISGNPAAYKTVKTDTAGNFVLTSDLKIDTQATIFKIVEDNFEDFSITINPEPLPDLDAISIDASFQLSSKTKNTILERSIANQIENAYFDIKKDSVQAFETPIPFNESNSKTYILDDFTKFANLKETIVEVATELNYKYKNGTYKLYAKNSDTNDNMDLPALVLIDGIVTHDLKPLFDSKIDNIYQISTTQGNLYYDGVQHTNGIIQVKTRNQDFDSKQDESYQKTTRINRPLPKKQYYSPNYESDTDNLKTIPDYRHQLLWLPDQNLDNQEKQISFYSSDIKGNYEIAIEGYTDSGKHVSVNQTITVN